MIRSYQLSAEGDSKVFVTSNRDSELEIKGDTDRAKMTHLPMDIRLSLSEYKETFNSVLGKEAEINTTIKYDFVCKNYKDTNILPEMAVYSSSSQ